MKYGSAKLLLAVDLAGTFLFAVEGSGHGNPRKPRPAGHDGAGIFNCSGGLRGARSADWRGTTVINQGLALCGDRVHCGHGHFLRLPRIVEAFPARPMMVLDAGGLALFAMAGTEKVLDYNKHPPQVEVLFFCFVVAATLDWNLPRIVNP